MPYIRTDAKTIGKIVERGNIDTPCTQIHDHSLFWEIHITSNANIAFVSYEKTDSQQIHQYQ
jgi:hypothetical protein